MKRKTQKNTASSKLLVLFLLCLAGGILFFLFQEFFKTHSHRVPAEGGILTESSIGSIKNLSPLAREHSLTDRAIMKLVFDGLLRYDPVNEKIHDGLAHLQVKDSTRYTLTLKENARFDDGHRVTVDDILFTFEDVIQNPHFQNTVLSNAFQYISLDVIDSQTVEFHLIEPNFFFPYLLTTPILPKRHFKDAYIEQITDSNFRFNRLPIGTGPYKIKNIIPNKDGSLRVFFTRNPYYYGKKPYIEQIVWYVYPSFEALEKSTTTTTLYARVPIEKAQNLHNTLAAKTATNYTLHEYILPRFVAVFFNLDSPLMNKPAIRKALSLSFNSEKVLANEHKWKALHSFFFFKDMEEQSQVLDYTQARHTLRDNGFPYDKEQDIRVKAPTKDPVSIKLLTSTVPPVYSRFAQVAAQTWENELDITIDLEILPPEEFQKKLSTREYDAVLFGENYSQNIDSLSTWHSSQSGKYNLSNLTNDSIDFLINEVRATGSQTDLFTLNKELNTLTPALILATPRYAHLVSSELNEFDSTFGGKNREHADRYTGIEKWYFYEELDWNLPSTPSRIVQFFQWLFDLTPPQTTAPQKQEQTEEEEGLTSMNIQF